MKTYTIIPENDERLHSVCEPFDFEEGIHGMHGEELFELLRDKMCEHNGIGLAANQLGILTRVLVLGDPSEKDSVIPIFNPQILFHSDDMISMDEGCISYPGLFLPIKRYSSVRVRFANHLGKVDTATFTGLTCRSFLHEYDHLDGIVFRKRAHVSHLFRADNKRKKLLRSNQYAKN